MKQQPSNPSLGGVPVSPWKKKKKERCKAPSVLRDYWITVTGQTAHDGASGRKTRLLPNGFFLLRRLLNATAQGN